VGSGWASATGGVLGVPLGGSQGGWAAVNPMEGILGVTTSSASPSPLSHPTIAMGCRVGSGWASPTRRVLGVPFLGSLGG